MGIFESENIITHHVANADLNVFFCGFDGGVYRYEYLTKYIMDALVDFAYGYHTGIHKTYKREMLIEAAKSLYSIDTFKNAFNKYITENSEFHDDIENKYLKRGEFGELILHLLLRDFFATTPLLAKIHFKDSRGVPVHGFDAIHIGKINSKNSLILGESKLYNDGKSGLSALVNDIKEHFQRDYLKNEFVLISKRNSDYKNLDDIKDLNTREEYKEFLEQKEQWFKHFHELISGKQKLSAIMESVTVPLLCTYTSKTFENHNNEDTKEFKDELDGEIKTLSEYFNTKLSELKHEIADAIMTDLNIILVLFPVPSKKELVNRLHQKLDAQQRA